MAFSTALIDLTKVWEQNWPDSTERAQVSQHLQRQFGMDCQTAREWMASMFSVGASPRDLFEVAEEWTSAGLPVFEALEWAESGSCLPPEAYDWWMRGFTARQVALIKEVLPSNRGGQSFAQAQADAVVWRDTDWDPGLVVLAVANDKSRRWVQQQLSDGLLTDHARGQLALEAGVFRGVDVHACTVNWEALRRSAVAAMRDSAWR